MQIIIEVKNRQVLQRVLDLLKITEWLGDIRIWKKETEQSKEELVYNFPPPPTPPETDSDLDYLEFWNVTKPQIGIDEIDRRITEMRED